MKHLITVILLSLVCVPAMAQKIKFTDSSNVWTKYMSYGPGLITHYYMGNTQIVINGKTYKSFGGDYIREEDDVVYILRFGDTTIEDRLYDYTMSIGDTLRIGDPTYITHYVHVLTSIDSTIINGIFHRVFFYTFLTGTNGIGLSYYVIEGIGSANGPLFPIAPTSMNPPQWLLCFSNNGTTPALSVPVNSFDNSSSCLLNTNPLIAKTDIDIYPVPAHDNIYVELTDYAESIVMTDIVGKTVATTTCTKGRLKYELNTSQLPSGIYFIRISTEKGMITRKVEIQ